MLNFWFWSLFNQRAIFVDPKESIQYSFSAANNITIQKIIQEKNLIGHNLVARLFLLPIKCWDANAILARMPNWGCPCSLLAWLFDRIRWTLPRYTVLIHGIKSSKIQSVLFLPSIYCFSGLLWVFMLIVEDWKIKSALKSNQFWTFLHFQSIFIELYFIPVIAGKDLTTGLESKSSSSLSNQIKDMMEPLRV